MPISGRTVRQQFIDYFKSQDHLHLPSSSLVPVGDPTLLLTSAGMVQFKPYFLGESTPPSRRLTTHQKCFRTVDIESVGDESHLTFFEMLGNFSIGDYFKRGAITFAWELLTQGYRLPPERLWASIYPTDEETFGLWQEITGMPASKIVRLHENWWGPAGETGPCGPDSEIFYDRGADIGCGRPDCAPGCDCPRFLEIWNLVLMQFNRGPDGKDTPLPRPSIDTGAGLERLTMVLNGYHSVYETDLFMPIMVRAADLVGVRYGQDAKIDFSLRVIGDHTRAVTFLIGDGVLPSNEGRGYVLRRILRRAVRHGHLLGLRQPFLAKTAAVVIEQMGAVYPELIQHRDFIDRVLLHEELRFRETLQEGLERLDLLMDGLAAKGEKTIPGSEAFKLYDTYGFPLDITHDRASERGFQVDEQAFKLALEEQRERARAAARFGLDERQEHFRALNLPATTFLGYETTEAPGTLLAILRDGAAVDSAQAGDAIEVALDQTPFYAEAGGQVGDTGQLLGPAGEMVVEDCQKVLGGVHVLIGQLRRGTLTVGQTVTGKVDVERRLDIARNHTATHLLHRALREVLGEHAQQRGSLVAPDRLRFDFAHLQAVTPEELQEIERRVNAAVRRNLEVQTGYQSFKEALASGVTALFGEKYGDTVRVVRAGDWTAELCGGTHLQRTGEIGFFHILSEGSVGAGLRRIEALTGRGAETYLRQRLGLLDEVCLRLQTQPENLHERLSIVLNDLLATRKEVEYLRRQLAKGQVTAIVAGAQQIDGVTLVSARVEAATQEALREQCDWVRDRLPSAIIVLGAIIAEKPAFVCAVSPDLVRRGYHAGQIIREVARVTGGSGGGRPEMAQAGGKDPARLDAALTLTATTIRQQLPKT